MTMIRCDLHKKLICPKYSFIDFFPLLFFFKERSGKNEKESKQNLKQCFVWVFS